VNAALGSYAANGSEPMADQTSVPRGCGYVITPKGSADIRELETCECKWSFAGGLVICVECETVYSLLRSSSHASPRPVAGGKPD